MHVGAWWITPLTSKKSRVRLENLGKLEFSRNSSIELDNILDFVNIIRRKNANFALALRKRLFCNAKQPLLPCKTYAFTLQNNRFCNALIMKRLCNRYIREKYLHIYSLLIVGMEEGEKARTSVIERGRYFSSEVLNNLWADEIQCILIKVIICCREFRSKMQ